MVQPKCALITGITGQDGSYLAELLLDKGYEVHGIIRRASTFNTDRIDHIYTDPHKEDTRLFLHYGDLNDGTMLRRIIEQVKPFEVFNLGAQSHVRVSFDSPEYTADTVGLGALRLLEAIRDYQQRTGNEVRFYQAGSSEMFGKVKAVPQTEETPFYPRSPYACAKVFAHWQTVNYRESYNLFACNGILFNHESPRRGETFVTRKITRGLANISQGLEACLYLGNLGALRDWGHAKDYVRMQWMMLQQEAAEDFVIATGRQISVRDFVDMSAKELGIQLRFEGRGADECAIVEAVTSDKAPAVSVGDRIVQIDPRYFRPAEVDTLLGDPTKAKTKLGWEPEISIEDMCAEMVANDLADSRRHAFLKANGYDIPIAIES